jgi:iron complex outermembrane recepter protein
VQSIGYQESDPIYQGDRDFSVFGIDSYTGTLGGSGTTVPARFTGTRIIDPLTGLPSTNPTVPNSGAAQIVPATGRASGRCCNAAGTAIVGGTYSFFNFNPYNIFQTPFQRYNMFAQANYEVSDAVEVYTRGMFSKNNVKTIIAPSGSFGAPVAINLNNPFLPAALRNQFCAFDVNPNAAVYTPRFTQGQCDAGAAAAGVGSLGYQVIGANSMFVSSDVDGNGTISPGEGYQSNPAITMGRRAVEVGPRISDYTSTVFDYRFGMRGAINETIDWDVSASYGESEKVQTIQNYTLQSRVRQSLLVNGTAANPVCQDASNGCVPTNFFGNAGTISPASADFLSDNSTSTVRTSLAQVRGVVLHWAANIANIKRSKLRIFLPKPPVSSEVPAVRLPISMAAMTCMRLMPKSSHL